MRMQRDGHYRGGLLERWETRQARHPEPHRHWRGLRTDHTRFRGQHPFVVQNERPTGKHPVGVDIGVERICKRSGVSPRGLFAVILTPLDGADPEARVAAGKRGTAHVDELAVADVGGARGRGTGPRLGERIGGGTHVVGGEERHGVGIDALGEAGVVDQSGVLGVGEGEGLADGLGQTRGPRGGTQWVPFPGVLDHDVARIRGGREAESVLLHRSVAYKLYRNLKFKERNYSRFRQFSDRFFGKGIICFQTPSAKELQIIPFDQHDHVRKQTNCSRTVLELVQGMSVTLHWWLFSMQKHSNALSNKAFRRPKLRIIPLLQFLWHCQRM